MLPLLKHIVWQALTGPQARFAAGTGGARRYAPGFSPIVGFEDPAHADLHSLATCCEPGEHFYCDGWTGPAPLGLGRSTPRPRCFKMVWEGVLPSEDPAPEAVPLGLPHAAQALELATLTQPGPFGLRTIELGEYFGVFEGPRLVAMAGERMQAGALREISGVCTLPAFQGRGWHVG